MIPPLAKFMLKGKEVDVNEGKEYMHWYTVMYHSVHDGKGIGCPKIMKG